MYRQHYKLLNSYIKPDAELLNNTKNKMLARLEAPKTINLKKFHKFGIVATCFVIGILLVSTLKNIDTQKNNTSPQHISHGKSLNQHNSQESVSNMKGQSRAAYHNIDLSLIKRTKTYNMLKFGFYFQEKLSMLAKNETGIDMNNGVHWEYSKGFTKDGLESSLNIAVIDPKLPIGDYTTKQSVLIDDATNNIIAYQTIYCFFDKDTMEFKNNFSIFYFDINHFKKVEFERLQNVTKVDGKINTNAFSSSNSVYFNMPHIKRMVYMEKGVAIVSESSIDPVLIDGIINEAESLELYEQTDKQHFNIMKSLIE